MQLRDVKLGNEMEGFAEGHFAVPSMRAQAREGQRLGREVLRDLGLDSRTGRARLRETGRAAISLSGAARTMNPWVSGTPTAIDLFAGGGGFSVGARAAGVDVIWAVNHWLEAVETYRRNHPDARFPAELENIALPSWDWRSVPHHDIQIASPSCKGHTRARGAERKEYDAYRTTAWAVIEAASMHLPEVIVVENVPEFMNWGTRLNDGRMYQAWKAALKAMDYSITENILNSADLGVPMTRTRLFVVARMQGEKIWIPRGQVAQDDWAPAGDCIDWTDEVRGQGRWNPISGRPRPLSRWVRDLIGRGRAAGMDRFFIPYFGTSAKKLRPLSADRPIGSPGTRSTFAVVDLQGRGRFRMVRAEELKLMMGFPKSYQLPRKPNGTVHVVFANTMLGNAVCPPVATHVFDTIRERMVA